LSAAITARAELSETSCSPDRPPNSTPIRTEFPSSRLLVFALKRTRFLFFEKTPDGSFSKNKKKLSYYQALQGTLCSILVQPVSEWLAQARRGLIELCVLQLISTTPHYGYELATALGAWGKALAASEGTLYPLLRRLQREGLVEATWQESPDGPPRKYYHLSEAGTRLLQSQLDEWDQLTQAIAHLRADGINTVDEEVPDGSGSERQPALSRRTATSARPLAGA